MSFSPLSFFHNSVRFEEKQIQLLNKIRKRTEAFSVLLPWIYHVQFTLDVKGLSLTDCMTTAYSPKK